MHIGNDVYLRNMECGRQPLKNLLSPLLNTLSQIMLEIIS